MKYLSVEEFAEVITGGTPSTSVEAYWNGDIPWLNSGELNRGLIDSSSNFITKQGLSNSAAKIMPIDTVLIALTGATTGVTALLKIRACANQSVTGILPSSMHIPKYLYYYLSSIREKIVGQSYGGAQKHISQGFVKKLIVPLPLLGDQKRIVKILDEADTLRRKRNQAIELLDDYLKSMFLKMFGQELPGYESWRSTKLKDLVKKIKGSMRTGPFGSDLLHSEFVDSGIAVIGIDNAVQNKFAWDQRRFITEKKYEKLKRYTLFPRDVIITIMGTVGKTAVIPKDIPLAINTKHLAAFTLDEHLANPYFISYSIRSDPLVVNQISHTGRGAIMTGLNLGIIKNLQLKLPPVEKQNEFELILQKTETLKQNMLAQSEELENQFQVLMQKAFKGRL